MKKILVYLLVFAMTVAGCLAMLLLATFAPQEAIDQHIIDSVIGLERETAYIGIMDDSDSAVLDNFTDALILMHSKGTDSGSKSTVLTNPQFIYGEDDPVQALVKYAWMVKPTPSSYYTRYWMGFRSTMRWLLTFLDYFQIRRYVAISLFTLLFVLMDSISKHLNRRHALVFALCVLMVRPYVICSSLQYSCCFLIAFIAMLAVPWLHKNPRFQGLYFLEVGMLTMYFDFYTTPVITFGLPMIYLCLLQAKEGRRISAVEVLKNVGIWLAGYIGMWLSKLVLTDLLTVQSGISAAWDSVSARLGLSGQRAARGSEYSPVRALQRVWEILIPDQEAVIFFWIILVAVLVLVIWKWSKKEVNRLQARSSAGILSIAILPVIWFCVTAQPIIIHAMFQYRSILVLFWAVSAYLCLITEKAPPKAVSENN